MKRCEKCNIVFNFDERSRCLYCNGLLTVADSSAGANEMDALREGFTNDESVILKIIQDRREVASDRKLYIVGTYFATQTLPFMYGFSRNEMKMGRGYNRFLIQPLNMASFLVIPWVIINLVDSLMLKMIYNAFCPKCGWKYKKISALGGHDPKECDYNQEYTEIIRDILSGKILQEENRFRRASLEKHVRGERSAYIDLCQNRRFIYTVLDVACVWFSVALMIVFVVMVIVPAIRALIHSVGMVEGLYLR